MKSYLSQLTAFFFLLVPISFCQISEYPIGVHQHDGFLLRLVPGFGFTQISLTLPDYEEDVFTFSGGFSFANTIQIGGAVSENLIIFGEASGVSVTNPSVKLLGEEVEDPGDVSITFGGVGPGITYYFMPENIYLSLSILANIANVYVEGDELAKSNLGFGFHFLAGKEWWVGEQWGVGVSVYFRYGTQSGEDVDDLTISGYSFGALFTATYN